MANFFNTINMNLVIPTVGVDPGPDWANNVNASLVTIDGHNHTAGSGVQIPPGGLNINADLTFNGNNITSLRSARFAIQLTTLAGASDLACIYSTGATGDLWWNNGGGTPVQITSGNSIVGAAGTITGLPSGSASAAFVAASGTFVFQQATSTGANLDIASLIIRYPGSYPSITGNYIALEAPSSLASGYALTLPALPAQTNVMTLGTTGIISSTTYDAVGEGMTSVGVNALFVVRTRPVASTIGVGGVALSGSSTTFSTASTTYVPVTGLSVTLATTGKPVRLVVCPDNSLGSTIQVFNGTSANVASIAFLRNGTFFGANLLGAGILPANLVAYDFQAAGTYTYTIQAKNFSGSGGGSVSISNCALVALEED